MNTYDDLVNDYFRAVEQALDGVPAARRDALLADLSDHIAAKLAETRRGGQGPAADPSEAEVRSVLDLLGDPHDLAAELEAADLEALDPDAAGARTTGPAAARSGTARSGTARSGTARSAAADPSAAEAAPIEINPGRKMGALIWVLITIAMVSLLCVGVVLAGVILIFTSR